jgi:pyruvate dehydrogenase E2 component (dihydrolipoamide acetyltransferase)
MPQLGMTMTEGSVVQWLRQPGETLEEGEFLFIVQTDKVDIEIESPCSGTFIESLVELGQIVPVGTVIGRIGQAGTGKTSETMLSSTLASRSAPVREQTVASIVPTPVVETASSPDTHGRKLANPRAKKLAKELSLDLSMVPDYEGRGRIVEADVQRFFDERLVAGSESSALPKAAPWGASKKETPSSVRNAIAERMTVSLQTIPHVYLTVLADATELVKLKRERLSEIEKQVGVRFSYTDVLLKALAVALRDHPEVNSYWQEGVVRRDRINVGFATQAGDRLVIPVVRDADRLPLAEVAKVRGALVERARTGKLQADDVGGASCSLSNLGSHGVDHFHAIINPPESVILTSGRIALRPMVVDEAVVPRPTVYLSLSLDHRLIYETAGAEFLNTVVRIVESPETLLQS